MATPPTRRSVLTSSAAFVLGTACKTHQSVPGAAGPGAAPVIDIHQHVPFSGRTADQLLAHQRRMGVTHTILLPAGTPVERPSTHLGKSNGLAAGVGSNEDAVTLASGHPGSYWFFVNEVADLPQARNEIERGLKLGARGIGEVKFGVDCDSPHIEMIATLAEAYRVPVLMHFEHERYNLGFARFHKVLEKFPRVTFVGHAQTFWANIDKNAVQSVLYPKTPVTPGGLTDRYLGDYANMYADQSAGSGLNALLRDEDHARAFLTRHQNKIVFGSDCSDVAGAGPRCTGSQILAGLRRLCPDKAAERKILFENAQALLRI